MIHTITIRLDDQEYTRCKQLKGQGSWKERLLLPTTTNEPTPTSMTALHDSILSTIPPVPSTPRNKRAPREAPPAPIDTPKTIIDDDGEETLVFQ